MPTQRPAQAIKLYGNPLSGHSHRVQLLLSLLDLPHEMIEVDLHNGALRQAEFLAKNPFGEIPVIEDGDLRLYDSNAILVYLASRYDDGAWLPRDPIGAAQVQRWLGLSAGLVYFGPNRARLAQLAKQPFDHAQALQLSERLLANLQRDLADKAFALGDAPTIADVSAYAYIALAQAGGVPFERWPNVRAWLARIEALPRFVPLLGAGA